MSNSLARFNQLQVHDLLHLVNTTILHELGLFFSVRKTWEHIHGNKLLTNREQLLFALAVPMLVAHQKREINMGTLMQRGLLVPAGVLLIASACSVSAWAQIARPVGTQSAQSTTPMAPATPSAPAAPTASPTSAAATAATAATPRTTSPAAPQQMLYYVCGNTNIDAHVTSPDPQHPFNLGVTFVSSSGGAPLADVSVKVRRHGRVLMEFVASGPHCLFSMPDAEYRVEGTYRGEMKFEIVQTGTMNAQIKW
ncbi:hypothetical protein [Paraburkholderia tagetis]|uniref:Uncharacterized protein n=1 Tax=Paraburkholderia tagetis TaxID=2913261 RepID=A0A9X1UH45_9BURK|nr:hypothetical protein [Paraburkholderia tagetis]MCG5076165.1 hypothetical protein [Paraburkholderia tagetis]